MNKEILKKMGYEKQVENYENNKCSWCGNKIKTNSFKNKISLDEYHISGFCQKCQDKTFN